MGSSWVRCPINLSIYDNVNYSTCDYYKPFALSIPVPIESRLDENTKMSQLVSLSFFLLFFSLFSIRYIFYIFLHFAGHNIRAKSAKGRHDDRNK